MMMYRDANWFLLTLMDHSWKGVASTPISGHIVSIYLQSIRKISCLQIVDNDNRIITYRDDTHTHTHNCRNAEHWNSLANRMRKLFGTIASHMLHLVYRICQFCAAQRLSSVLRCCAVCALNASNSNGIQIQSNFIGIFPSHIIIFIKLHSSETINHSLVLLKWRVIALHSPPHRNNYARKFD